MNPPSKPHDRWTAEEVPYVCEDGEAFGRYRVESKSNPEGWVLVDLTDRGGHGSCSCENFHFVANPNFKRIGQRIPYAKGRTGYTECKHIASALAHFHLYVTIPMLAKLRNGIPAPKQQP